MTHSARRALEPTSSMPHRHAAGAGLWSAYWQEFCPEDVPHDRCHIPSEGRPVIDRHWALFADALPVGAHVIDIGSGAGIAGRLLLGRRSDLNVTGIDFADVPIPDVPNLTIHPWVAMEALPFDAGRFDAAISLFGIEYGEIEQTAPELARVLRPGARFSFLIHHVESGIVREGTRRRRALLDLLSGKVKAPFLAGDNTGYDHHNAGLRSRYPGEPSIKLFTNYLRHHVTGTRSERQGKWRELLDALEPEIALLGQLEKSAKSDSETGSWLVPLLPIMRIVSVSIIRVASGQPIAWQVSGIR